MNLSDHLATLLPAGSRLRFGELLLDRDARGLFSARHSADESVNTSPTPANSVQELRELAKYDEDGNYRPLKTAPGLRRGWITSTEDPPEFLRRLDAIYPGLFATWIASSSRSLAPVPLRGTLDRQTGMYRFAGTITDDMAVRIVSELCGAGCLRRVIWPVGSDGPPLEIPRDPGEIPLLCTEACTFAVSRARELAKEAFEAANQANQGNDSPTPGT